jgi:HD-GYP domain-containing protein (c-di-GMP phosphodiesterase class II)
MSTRLHELGRRLPGLRPARGASVRDDTLVEESRSSARLGLTRREARASVVVATAFAAAVAAIAVWAPDRSGRGVATAALLVGCYAVAARVRFEVGSGLAVPTQLVFVPMLFLVPLAAVPLLVVAGFVLSTLPEHLRGERHPSRLGLHVVSAAYSVGPVTVIALAGEPSPAVDVRMLAILAAALAAQFALDFGGWAALGYSPREVARALRAAWQVDLVLTPLGLAIAAAGGSDRYAVLLGLPLVWLLAEFARQRSQSVDRARDLSQAYLGTALLLGDVVEADDSYTGLHSRDVVGLVLAVCDHLGLGDDDRHRARLTALLHDVGKVEIPKEIIRKPGPLDADERALIETHTLAGQRMLDKVGGLLEDVGLLVRSCHERWDGGGYPDRLAGETIPLVARIVCACDAWSAMTTDRSYRAAVSHSAALEELHRCAGTQFDPRVVAALIAVVGPAELVELAPAA